MPILFETKNEVFVIPKIKSVRRGEHVKETVDYKWGCYVKKTTYILIVDNSSISFATEEERDSVYEGIKNAIKEYYESREKENGPK